MLKRLHRSILTITLGCLIAAGWALPSFAAGPEQEAAQVLSEVIGVPIEVSDFRVAQVKSATGLPVHLPYVQQATNLPGAKYLMVRVRDPRFTSAVFPVFGPDQERLLGALFVFAVGPASPNLHHLICPTKVLDAAGICATVDLQSHWGGCPFDRCSGAGVGGGGVVELETCLIRMCSPWGHCMGYEVPKIPGQPCPSDVCSSDAECETTAQKKSCTYKRCDSILGPSCSPWTIQVDASATCPSDECTSDSECESSDGGSILDDILETQGSFDF